MAMLIVILFFMVSLINDTVSQFVDCKGSTCNCPNTSGETCVLGCDNTDVCKESTLNCRANDPCEIQCTQTTSCSAGTTINAATATDVTITCENEDSCIDSIYITCGIGHCKLVCNHPESCIDWGFINVSLSSSFHCVGYCPTNIPYSFDTWPTVKPTVTPSLTAPPTVQPTLSPTMQPSIHSNNPTIARISYIIIENNETDTKKMLMIGGITIGFCISCVATLWLFYMVRKIRRQNISKKDHKPTISTSITNIEYDLDSECIESDKHLKSEFVHKSPSMDLIINAKETPIRESILNTKYTTNDGVNNETDMDSSFTIETMEQYSGHNNNDSLSLCFPSINHSESGIDYNDKCRRNSSESVDGTPSGLPAIPDYKSVNCYSQSLNHLMVEHKISTSQLPDMEKDNNSDMTMVD